MATETSKKNKKQMKDDIGDGEVDVVTLTKQYDMVKQKVTAQKEDFMHLPKQERGKALRKMLKKNKRLRQEERMKLRERLGPDAPQKEAPKTIESTREYDETMVQDDDDEIEHDEAHDEFSSYFNRETLPKILITMSPYAKKTTWKFCFELQKCIPNAEIFSRKGVPLKKVVKQAIEKEYTDILVVHEDHKKPNGIIFCHLPEGPTAYFKINSLTFTKDIKRSGESTSHYPEVILNNFNTRLGHRYFSFYGYFLVAFFYIYFFKCVTMLTQRLLLVVGRQMRLRITFVPSLLSFNYTCFLRQRFAWGEDAIGPQVPVGGKMGASENPELHTYDGVYNGTPSKGDVSIPESFLSAVISQTSYSYFYRAPPLARTYIDRCITYFISAVLWAWFTYHMYYHSGHLLGHWYMPNLYEFTDEELGIPADSAEDAEYWGNHKKQYGTYR
uniref:Brix domain-containing protein n=1 Tax=Heterorhabditis bacteriophora TaxID=37862 RepID=A0A1I7XTX1_HETBA